MNNTLPLKYFENTKYQAVEIPYKDNKLSIIIFLPKSTTGIEDFENSLSFDQYLETTNSFENETVQLSFPKFTTSCDFTLNKSLSDLGMSIAFDDQMADFSGMTGNKDLYIGWVVHKAYIEVIEEGTEAAAATAVIMETKSLKQNFRADHPFLFIIRDTETGSILFIGKIIKPAMK